MSETASGANVGKMVDIVMGQPLGMKGGDDQLFVFLGNLWSDVGYAGFYWGLLALALALAFTWWFSNDLQRRQATDQRSQFGSLKVFGVGGLIRILPPLCAFVFLAIAHRVLQHLHWEHLHVFYLGEVLLLAWFIIRVLVYVLRCILPHGGFLARSEQLICLIVWCFPVLELTGLSGLLVRMLESVSFSAGKQQLNLWLLIHGAVTVGISVLFALWLASFIESRLVINQYIDRNVREVLLRVIKAVLSVVALLFSLSFVGIDVTTLSVFSGALAVGLGLGLQKIASSYVSGFIILLDRSIRLGDSVSLDNSTTGTVTRITTRYTVLRHGSGIKHIIPNEYLVNNIVRNLSFSDRQISANISVQVGYNTDLEAVMPMMSSIALQHPRVLANPAPGVTITAFADNGINLSLGFWIGDPERGTGGVCSDIYLALWKAFREHGIEIPFPQREVRMLNS